MVFISNQLVNKKWIKQCKKNALYILVFVRFLIYKKSYKLLSIAQAPTIYKLKLIEAMQIKCLVQEYKTNYLKATTFQLLLYC